MNENTLSKVLLILLAALLWLPACSVRTGGSGGGDDDDDSTASDDDDDDSTASDDDDDTAADDDDSTSDCAADETEDCNGNCGPTGWLGDGECDDSLYSYEGNLIDFNCAVLDFDEGDCGGGDDDDSTTGGCLSHTECSSDEFCADDNECEGVIGREFTFYLDYAFIQPGPGAGTQGWGTGDGAPDGFVEIETPTDSWESSTIDDTLSPEWFEDWTGVFNVPMTITFYDRDGLSHDEIEQYTYSTADELADLVRLGASFQQTAPYITWTGGVVPTF